MLTIDVGSWKDPFGEALLRAAEKWVRETREGRIWLERVASEVGVPVQLTLEDHLK